jgi:hypothetical protein
MPVPQAKASSHNVKIGIDRGTLTSGHRSRLLNTPHTGMGSKVAAAAQLQKGSVGILQVIQSATKRLFYQYCVLLMQNMP